MTKKLPLPVGNTNYKEICRESYYIDKTLLVKELLDEKNKIILFTRPRRFGKTLNMDMLRTFLKKLLKLPVNISRIKKFGSRAKNISIIRENILLSISL